MPNSVPDDDVLRRLAVDIGERLYPITATARTYAGANEEYADHGE